MLTNVTFCIVCASNLLRNSFESIYFTNTLLKHYASQCLFTNLLVDRLHTLLNVVLLLVARFFKIVVHTRNYIFISVKMLHSNPILTLLKLDKTTEEFECPPLPGYVPGIYK